MRPPCFLVVCCCRSIHRLGFSCKFVQTGHPGLGNIKSKCYCFQNDQRPKTVRNKKRKETMSITCINCLKQGIRLEK